MSASHKGVSGLGRSLAEIFSIPRKRSTTIASESRLDKNALAKARRLAAPLGVVIERDGAGEYWVTHPSDDEGGPCEGNHFCARGREVLAAVEAYATFFAGNV
jgi:hypothetical protein